MAAATQITKKKKAVLDGVFKAELNNFLMKELAEDGYSGVEVRRTPTRAEVIIMATRTQSVLGERGRRIKELTSVVQKRFGMEEGTVELYAEKVNNRGLCAVAQCESLRYKLVGGLAVRRACYGVLRFIMESEAKGCEVIVSGKLRGQRAKAMKFVDGLMIHSGNPVNDYIQQAVRHVKLRQGVIGIKVKIMLPHDPRGNMGPKLALPDQVHILDPTPEVNPDEPHSEHFQLRFGKMVQRPKSPVLPQQSGEDIRQLEALLREKRALLSSASDETAYPQIQRLVDLEIYRIRQKLFQADFAVQLDLPAPKEEKVTLVEKLFLPCQKYPDVNFVGRIIGPRGSTAKQIEAATGCKVMIRGKGSMREGDSSPRSPKHNYHLEEDLHVLLHCEDTPNRARVRVAKAIDLINKISIPSENGPDELKKKQLIELAILNGTYRDKKSSAEKSPTIHMVTPSSSDWRTHGSVESASPRNLSPLSDKCFCFPTTPSLSTKKDSAATTWIWSQLGVNTPSPIGPPMKKLCAPTRKPDNNIFNFDLFSSDL